MKISKLTIRIAVFLIIFAGFLGILFAFYPNKVEFVLELFGAFLVAGGTEWFLQKLSKRIAKRREKKNPLLD